MSVLKLQNYTSQCNSCAFFREIEEKLFWVIEAINEANATNSIMNLSHTLHFIADAKALCSIRYSSGNIEIKSCWGPADPPQLHYVGKNLSIQRVKTTRWLAWNETIKKHSSHIYQKETPAQLFSCELCEILQNSFFKEHVWTCFWFR